MKLDVLHEDALHEADDEPADDAAPQAVETAERGCRRREDRALAPSRRLQARTPSATNTEAPRVPTAAASAHPNCSVGPTRMPASWLDSRFDETARKARPILVYLSSNVSKVTHDQHGQHREDTCTR